MARGNLIMCNEIHELNVAELAAASGGMNFDWPDYYKDQPNVIDARGGSHTAWGITVTYDVNGKASSVSPA